MRWAVKIVFSGILFIAALVLIFSLLGFIKQGDFLIGPYRFYAVLSGSMSPQFDTGSMIVVRKPDSSLLVGDIITFKSPHDHSAIITHRIVELIKNGGEVSYVTQGDANEQPDLEPILDANVLGQVVCSVPFIGYMLQFAKSREGMAILIIIPGIILVISESIQLMRMASQFNEMRF